MITRTYYSDSATLHWAEANNVLASVIMLANDCGMNACIVELLSHRSLVLEVPLGIGAMDNFNLAMADKFGVGTSFVYDPLFWHVWQLIGLHGEHLQIVDGSYVV